jgi:4-hydroxyphenylpyruvate dioxygenase
MKTSIATVTISGELPEKLEAIARAGFDGVEIFENDFLAFDGSPADVGKMVRDHGLEITLFQPFRDFEGMPEPHRSRTFDRAERKFDVMQELGTDLVLVCSNVSPVSLGGIDRAAADFLELGERAAKRGLRVGYEALAWGRHISDHATPGRLCAEPITRTSAYPRQLPHASRKIDVNSIRSIPKEKIFIVQLADAPLIDMDLLYWSRHFATCRARATSPSPDFTEAVAATGYDGYFSLEIFNDQFRGGSAVAIAADGHRSLIYLGDQVRRDLGDKHLTGAAMPKRASVDGVGFVEFATDEEDAIGLVALLHTLGFRKTAVHRTKKVSIFEQGDIRILVNVDQAGFANAAYAVHGTFAYAIALGRRRCRKGVCSSPCA